MSADLRPCPDCGLMTTDYREERYAFPGELEGKEGKRWRRAALDDVTGNRWRCGACIGPATRAWRELGRPASARRPPDGLLLRLREHEL